MNKIYVTSDLHLMHDRNFIYSARGFENVFAMNTAIVERWNSLVDEEDDVYILGDLMLQDNESAIWYIKRLRGKIHIILGNHDSTARVQMYKELYNVVEVAAAAYLKYQGYTFYLSHYPTLCTNFDDVGLRKCVINLCGHTHTENPFLDWEKHNALIFHCEMDTNNCTPWLLDEIIEKIKDKFGGKKNAT